MAVLITSGSVSSSSGVSTTKADQPQDGASPPGPFGTGAATSERGSSASGANLDATGVPWSPSREAKVRLRPSASPFAPVPPPHTSFIFPLEGPPARPSNAVAGAVSTSGAQADGAATKRDRTDEPAPRKVDYDWLTVAEAMEMHRAMLADPARKDAKVVFLGDSITRGWTTKAPEVWKTQFGDLKPLNLGLPGDQTQNILWRLEHGALEELEPEVVVLLAGVNNLLLGEHTAEETATGIEAVVRRVHEQTPSAKVLLLGVLPAFAPESDVRRSIQRTNAILAQKAEGMEAEYLDIGKNLVGKDNAVSQEIMPDSLHPEAAGYEVIARAIGGKIKTMMRGPQGR